MAKVRIYDVSVHPGRKLPYGFMTSFSLGGPPAPRTLVGAASFAELEAAIAVFVGEQDAPVYSMDNEGLPAWIVSVRVGDGGRKPAGFDAWNKAYDQVHVYKEG